MFRVLKDLFRRSIQSDRTDIPAQGRAPDRRHNPSYGRDIEGSRPDVGRRSSVSALQKGASAKPGQTLSWPARDLVRSRRLPQTGDATTIVEDRGRSGSVEKVPEDDATVVWRGPQGKGTTDDENR